MRLGPLLLGGITLLLLMTTLLTNLLRSFLPYFFDLPRLHKLSICRDQKQHSAP
jgi:hypothetical protein